MLVLTPQRRQDPNTLCSEVPGSGLEISGGHDAYSRFDWRDCYGRVSSCDVAGVDPMVSRKELVDISGQGLCGGWKARNSRKRSRRSPEARTAGGPTLRGWHDLLDVRPNRGDLTSGELPAPSTKPNKSQRLLLGDLGPLRPASTIAAPPTRPPSRLHPKAKRPRLRTP